MKLLLLALTLSLTSPAMAQQRPTRAPQPAARPAPPVAASGWTVPMPQFAETYNATASRLHFEERAVETDCRDRGTPVRVCTWRIGPLIQVNTTAAEDRTTLKEISVFANPNDGQGAVIYLMGAFGTLMHQLEPNVAMGERTAATMAIFDTTRLRSRPNEVRLGNTRFTLLLIPGLQMILSAERGQTS